MKTTIRHSIQDSVILIVVLFLLTSCSSRFFSYKGAVVTQKDQMIPLQETDRQGVWKTNELAVNYHYWMTPEALKISGTIKLLGGFAVGFSSIHRLSVQLLFLDSHGVVIENAALFSAESDRSMDITPMKFERTITVPQETRYISFTYDGVLVDGSTDSTSVNIGNSPSRSLSW